MIMYKWDRFAFSLHMMGCFMHLLYVFMMIFYIFNVYVNNEDGD